MDDRVSPSHGHCFIYVACRLLLWTNEAEDRLDEVMRERIEEFFGEIV